jgi:hypothetical protein
LEDEATGYMDISLHKIYLGKNYMMVDIPAGSENDKTGLFSGLLSLFSAFLTLTALVIIAPSVGYGLRDVAKVMIKGSG